MRNWNLSVSRKNWWNYFNYIIIFILSLIRQQIFDEKWYKYQSGLVKQDPVTEIYNKLEIRSWMRLLSICITRMWIYINDFTHYYMRILV